MKKFVCTVCGYIYEGTYKYDDFVKSGNSYTLKDNVPYFRLSIFYHTGCSGDWIAHSFQSRQSGIRIQASYAR